MAPIGSTMPLNAPIRNAFHLLCPSPRKGMETIAPSGMFWMAIPTDMAMAAAAVIPMPSCSAAAMTTPTAMPSGKL